MSERLFDDNNHAGWLIVPNWRELQHYREGERDPVWIKTYLRLLRKDEYLDLTPAARAVLHGIWLLTASRRGVVSGSTARLSRALSMKVTREHLASLNQAGFIEFSASKPLAVLAGPSYPQADLQHGDNDAQPTLSGRRADVEPTLSERPASVEPTPSEHGKPRSQAGSDELYARKPLARSYQVEEEVERELKAVNEASYESNGPGFQIPDNILKEMP